MRGLRSGDSLGGPEVYGLLRNPIRREILALLYTRGEMSATQLKLLLNVSYGTLYYHLDFLKPLLSQVRRGRYVLNERGLLVVERMMREMGMMDEGRSAPSLVRVLSTAPLMERVAASPAPFLALGAPAAAAYLILLYLLPVKPVLLHLSFGAPSISTAPLSLALVLGYVLLAGEILSPHRGGFGGLIASALISYLPVDIYLGLLALVRYAGFEVEALVPVLQAGFVVVHVVQLVMLAAALTHSRGVGWEKSLTAALLLSYISLLAAHYNLI